MTSADEQRAALASPEYRSAFEKAMTGREAEWSDAERAAAVRVREVTGSSGPGFPPPVTEEG